MDTDPRPRTPDDDAHNTSTERRITRLEELLYFQEQTVNQLNEALTQQQFQLDDMQKRLERAEERVRVLSRMLLDHGGEDGGPPPHYL